jgi:hypothetical protein
MSGRARVQRPKQPATGPAHPSPASARTLAASLLQLQRRAGNQAVGRILARDPLKTTPPGFHGDGKHRATDARYAAQVGKADAARLVATHTLSDADKADINAKLGWFKSAAHDAYLAQVKPALVAVTRPPLDMSDDPDVKLRLSEKRQDAKDDIRDWYNDIRDLKKDQLNLVWKVNASQVEPPGFGREVLMIVIAIVAEGMGGVVYGVIEDMLSHATPKLLAEFTQLAGLEAGDLAAEKALHEGANAVMGNVKLGVAATTEQKALETNFTKEAFEQLFRHSKGSVLDTYVAAMNLQLHLEADAVKQAFSDSMADKSYAELLKEKAAQKVIHDELLTHQDRFLRELTIGYIRMIDEAYIGQKLKEKQRTRERTYQKDEDELFLRGGEVNLNMVDAHFSIGQWGAPNLGFSGFELVAGGMNTKVLEHLEDTPVEKLPVMARFTFFAQSPYTSWGSRDGIDLHFARDPKGRFYMTGGEDSMEWLASYYTQKTDEHSDDERKKYAPLGAEKLYDAIKDKSVKKVRSVELHEIGDWDK